MDREWLTPSVGDQYLVFELDAIRASDLAHVGLEAQHHSRLDHTVRERGELFIGVHGMWDGRVLDLESDPCARIW